MASGSLKDVIKSLNNAFSGPLEIAETPTELQTASDAYLAKHRDSDDNSEQRLQDELVATYDKYVAKEAEKLGVFLLALKALRPAIQRQAYLQYWWRTAIQPVIDGIGHTRLEIQHASAFLLDIMDYDVQKDKNGEQAKVSATFVKILLDACLKRSRLVDSEDEILNKEDQFIASQISEVLFSYGRKKPQEFLEAIDRLVVVKEQRMQTLGLLSSFVRHQPPHLYLVRNTSLIQHLMQCLLIDTSSTVISLALTTLIMFLPHIPTTVKKHLPRLFLIYSRILYWDRFRPSSSGEEKNPSPEDDGDDSDDEATSTTVEAPAEESWDKLESSFDAAESSTPELMHYFTFLYGLYPLNFTSYIRKPRKYLKNINFPRADEFDLDQKVIRSRSEQFSRLHILHPSFTQTTVEEELINNRWDMTDPADVVAECMSLSLSITTLNAPIDIHATPTMKPAEIPSAFVKTEDIPTESLLGYGDSASIQTMEDVSSNENGSTTSWLNLTAPAFTAPSEHNHFEGAIPPHRAILRGQAGSRSHSPAFSSPLARASDDYGDSPTLGATITPLPQTRQGRNGSITSLQNVAGTSPRLSPMHVIGRDELPRSPAVRAAPQAEANHSFLQREVTLLKNDLNFERFLKQQHLTHIGRLQRKHIREATIEAETQSLIDRNRALKNKLAELNKAFTSLKKETATRQNQSKKYEAELTGKMRKIKEDERVQRASEESLMADFHKAQTDLDHLRQIVIDSEARALQANQEVASVMLKLDQLEILHKKLQELEARLRDYETRELEFQRAAADKDNLKAQLATLELRLQSRDSDFSHDRIAQARRIHELEVRNLALRNPTAGGKEGELAPPVQHMIDQAVASSKAKYNSLKKEHVALRDRLTEVESRNRDLQREATDAAAAAAVAASAASAAMAASKLSYSANSASGMLSSSPSRNRYVNSPPLALSSRNSSRRGNSIDEDAPVPSYSRHVPIPIPTNSRYDNPASTSLSGTPPSSYRDHPRTSSRQHPSPKLEPASLYTTGSSAPVLIHPPMPPQPPHSYGYPTSPTSTQAVPVFGSPSNRTLHRSGTLPRTGPNSSSLPRGNSDLDSPETSVGRSGSLSGTGSIGSSSFPTDTTDNYSASNVGRRNSHDSRPNVSGGIFSRAGGSSGSRMDGKAYGTSSKTRDLEEDRRKEKKDKSKISGLLGIRGNPS